MGRLRPGMRPAGLVLAVLLALGGVLGTATAAAAHDKLQSTTPKKGANLAKPPATVMLTFNQPAFKLGSRIRVVGPAGDVAVGQPTFAGQVVRQPIRPDAPAGDYTVEWQVTSSDGHPIAGTDEEDGGSSTGLVVGLTAGAALVLLAAAGAVAWASRRNSG